MNKELLKKEITEVAAKNGMELPAGWYNRSEENLQKLLDELKGNKTDSKEEESSETFDPGNPFKEKVIKVLMPIDKQNPKIKVVWYSINGHALWFPLGKMAYMPESFHKLYLNSQESEAKALEKTYEYFFKEV